MLISYFRKLFFGDEFLILRMPSSMLKDEKTYIPMESENTGYCIQVQDGKIIITRRNLWRLITGLPSIYRFVGQLAEIHQTGDIVSITGVVTINPIQKMFLSIWFGFLFIFLFINLAQAISLVWRIMFSSNSVPDGDLATIGFMLGSGGLVFMFGVALWAAVRILFRGERQRLIDFCTNSKSMKSD